MIKIKILTYFDWLNLITQFPNGPNTSYIYIRYLINNFEFKKKKRTMPLKCFVLGCNIGLLSEPKMLKNEGKRYPSIFHLPEVILSIMYRQKKKKIKL